MISAQVLMTRDARPRAHLPSGQPVGAQGSADKPTGSQCSERVAATTATTTEDDRGSFLSLGCGKPEIHVDYVCSSLAELGRASLTALGLES